MDELGTVGGRAGKCPQFLNQVTSRVGSVAAAFAVALASVHAPVSMVDRLGAVLVRADGAVLISAPMALAARADIAAVPVSRPADVVPVIGPGTPEVL